MAKTSIEWADFTFNPWLGCTKVSPACDHCYAEGWAKRSGMVQWGGDRRRTSEHNWKQPLKWNAEAERLGIRYRVFCASLADVFDNQVPAGWRTDLFELIAKTPHLDWLLLTKRIGNARGMLNAAIEELSHGINSWDELPWPNVWIGATICNQEEADRDIPKLFAVPAAKRFLSIEPLLGTVNLEPFLWQNGSIDMSTMEWNDGPGILKRQRKEIHWVIVGGESGAHARPMHPDWALSLRDQCKDAGVSFLFKQWGEWEIGSLENGHRDGNMTTNKDHWVDLDGSMHKPSSIGHDNAYAMVKVGKKKAGRLLDGRTWDEVPG